MRNFNHMKTILYGMGCKDLIWNGENTDLFLNRLSCHQECQCKVKLRKLRPIDERSKYLGVH